MAWKNVIHRNNKPIGYISRSDALVAGKPSFAYHAHMVAERVPFKTFPDAGAAEKAIVEEYKARVIKIGAR